MKNAVLKKGIPFIVHFTRLNNLENILLKGIIPRATLEKNGEVFQYNDSDRLDECQDANSLSIGHPNYKMFWSLRCTYRDHKWVVIVCKSDVLWQKDCAFCYENASSNNVKKIPIDDRKSVLAFEGLFSPSIGKPSRIKLGLPNYFPTHPQAEVLIFDIIEPSFIIEIACENIITQRELSQKYTGFTFKYRKDLFDARIDYSYW